MSKLLGLLAGGLLLALLTGPLAVAVLLFTLATPTAEAALTAQSACTAYAPPSAGSAPPSTGSAPPAIDRFPAGDANRGPGEHQPSSARRGAIAPATFPLPQPGPARRHSLHTPAAAVPASVAALYVAAADRYRLPWQLLAGIGMIETRHGAITATSSAGARGLMQFMPATFAAYGVDGDRDGRADIRNPADSIHSAANYLLASGARQGPDGVRQALFAYNHAHWYVNDVLTYAHAYATGAVTVTADATCPAPLSAAGAANSADGGGLQYRYVLPVGAARSPLTAPHHDYPALDIAVPVGTPYYAITNGIVTRTRAASSCGRGVILRGDDGAVYTYCHGSAWTVAAGQRVTAGQQLGLTGNTGRSTGPHLHLQIRADGVLRCPQRLLTAVAVGQSVPSVRRLPSSLCVT